MMLIEKLGPILEQTRSMPRVLDVGGASIPLNTATHVLDVMPFERFGAPLSADEPIRFSRDNYLVHDICTKPWPFPDGYFDYSFCAQTVEDVRDPIGACEELMRVSRQGYIEFPSRLRECFHAKSGYLWRRIAGRPIRVGYGHHRWPCELDGNGISFTAKPSTLFHSRRYFITREEVGRDLTPQESFIGFFWTGRFPVAERLLIAPGETEADFIRFKKEALARLRR